MQTQLTKQQTAEVIRGFITAALWASTDDQGEPLDDNYTADSLTASARLSIESDVTEWVQANAADLQQYATERTAQGIDEKDGTVYAHAGHDLFLTSAGHGAGFWDRGLGELGDRLTEAARDFSSLYLYVTETDQLDAA